MKSKLRKKIVAAGLAAMMMVCFAPTTVFASEDPVSREKLEIMVNEEVEKLDFSNLGIDGIIDGINKEVTNAITGTVNSLVTTDAIKELIRPTIKSLVQVALKDVTLPAGVDVNKIIDAVLDNGTINGIVDAVLTSQLTQDIIARTIEYAIADIMDIVKIPTVGEIVDASKEGLAEKAIEEIWSSKKQGEYNLIFTTIKYDYNPFQNITLKYQRPNLLVIPTGWNRTSILLKIKGDVLLDGVLDYEKPDLSSINYEEIVLNAAKRAVTDVINEKIVEVKATINTHIQTKIAELKAEAEKAIQDAINQALESIKNKFPWKPWRPY